MEKGEETSWNFRAPGDPSRWYKGTTDKWGGQTKKEQGYIIMGWWGVSDCRAGDTNPE